MSILPSTPSVATPPAAGPGGYALQRKREAGGRLHTSPTFLGRDHVVERLPGPLVCEWFASTGAGLQALRMARVYDLDVLSRGLPDLSFVRSTKNLRELRVDDPELPTTAGVDGALLLEAIELHQCAALASLDGVGALRGLVSLVIRGSPSLVDLAPLADARALTWLDVHDTGVRDLRPLRDLALERLDLSGAPVEDLGPLLGNGVQSLVLDGTPHVRALLPQLAAIPRLCRVSLAGCGLRFADLPAEVLERGGLAIDLGSPDRHRRHRLLAFDAFLRRPVELNGVARERVLVVPSDDPEFARRTEGCLHPRAVDVRGATFEILGTVQHQGMTWCLYEGPEEMVERLA